MKKIIGITSVFLVLGLIAALVIGFVKTPDISVPAAAIRGYKFCTGIEIFIKILPSVLITGFVIGCSVYFGQNSEGSSSRFSEAMAKRFKAVMILSIAFAAVLTIGEETVKIAVGNKKKIIVNQPKLINDYIKVGNQLLKSGYYNRAQAYADAALKLSPSSKEAARLADNAEIAINKQNNSNIRIRLSEAAKTEMDTVEKVNIDPEQISEVYKYYLMAKEAFEKEEWFNAHYYADVGLNLASPKDPNLEELQKILNTAWNNISDTHRLKKDKNQENFDRKYEGYLALVEKDDLRAYYIFRELYLTSRELQKDPDVLFYLDIAENRVSNRFFFIDETLELKTFENANDVYFSYTYKDGSKDIVYFKGITNVKTTGKSIQYLRDLTIESVARNGEHYRIMTVPYAKVLPVDVRPMNESTKQILGIDEKTDFVPYVMLKSVGRDSPEIINEPRYEYANGEVVNTPEYLLLPLSYSDFVMLENANADPNGMSLFSLIKMLNKASSYGYSDEVYGQVLLNRIFYPMWIIILFVLLASFGWNTRMNPNHYFKTSWIWVFPGLIVIAYGFFNGALFVFKLMNYVLLGAVGLVGGIWVAIVFYLVILIVASIYFMARTTKI